MIAEALLFIFWLTYLCLLTAFAGEGSKAKVGLHKGNTSSVNWNLLNSHWNAKKKEEKPTLEKWAAIKSSPPTFSPRGTLCKSHF